jgi:hypothetical protein
MRVAQLLGFLGDQANEIGATPGFQAFQQEVKGMPGQDPGQFMARQQNNLANNIRGWPGTDPRDSAFAQYVMNKLKGLQQ